MRFHWLPVLLMLMSNPARAEVVTWELEGTIDVIGVRGAEPGAEIPLFGLGVEEGARLQARFVLDTNAPAPNPSPDDTQREFSDVVLSAEAAIGDFILPAPAFVTSRLFVGNQHRGGVLDMSIDDLVDAGGVFQTILFRVTQIGPDPIVLEIPTEPLLPDEGFVTIQILLSRSEGTAGGVAQLFVDVDSFRRVRRTPVEAEPLKGYRFLGRSGILRFFVHSNGCTRRDDFRVDVRESEPTQLLLVRTRPDLCRSIARTVPIHFSLAKLGLAEGQTFVVVNRLSVETVPNVHRRRRSFRHH